MPSSWSEIPNGENLLNIGERTQRRHFSRISLHTNDKLYNIILFLLYRGQGKQSGVALVWVFDPKKGCGFALGHVVFDFKLHLFLFLGSSLARLRRLRGQGCNWEEDLPRRVKAGWHVVPVRRPSHHGRVRVDVFCRQNGRHLQVKTAHSIILSKLKGKCQKNPQFSDNSTIL